MIGLKRPSFHNHLTKEKTHDKKKKLFNMCWRVGNFVCRFSVHWSFNRRSSSEGLPDEDTIGMAACGHIDANA
tara:strand:- start:475 stop:693 length:219 start_codon:yes stop_codon:yes gene_type:complete